MKNFIILIYLHKKNRGKYEIILGFVLINSNPSIEHDAYNKLSKFQQIAKLQPLFGEHDLISKIDANSLERVIL